MKLRMTKTIVLDDSQYGEGWWANIESEVYLNNIEGLEIEEVDDEERPGEKIKRVAHTLENAYKIDLYDLREKTIDFDGIRSADNADETAEYELIDD